MTEPKKRGRPPGSGKKKETGLQNTDMILPGGLGEMTFANGDTRTIEKVFKANDGSVTLTIAAKKPPEETPFPDNWSAMGKIERLKWLTANR